MKIEIYVQARMGSTRLPGKVLMPVLGKPLLGYLIERLQQIKNGSPIVILTSTSPQDDSIATYCQTLKVECFRGSEDNVLERYYQAALMRRPDAIVRITADCPLTDPEIVDQAIETFCNANSPFDYLSNSLQRTFPRGLDVEIFSFKALEKAYQKGREKWEQEHVTPYIYHHPDEFRVGNFASEKPLEHHRWTVDTPEDFLLVKQILEALYPKNPQFRLKHILKLFKEHPDWIQLNAHVEQKKTKE